MAAWIAAAALVFFRQGKLTFHGDEITPAAQTSYFIMLTLVPLVCHWLAADLIDRVWPRLFLRSDSRYLLSVFFRGVIAGTLSLLAAAALAPFLDPVIHGAFTVAACCITSSQLVVALAAKARVNHCASCNYDLVNTPRNAPCPECGRKFSRVEAAITKASANESSLPPSLIPQSTAAHQ